jgi:hypothetical protein
MLAVYIQQLVAVAVGALVRTAAQLSLHFNQFDTRESFDRFPGGKESKRRLIKLKGDPMTRAAPSTEGKAAAPGKGMSVPVILRKTNEKTLFYFTFLSDCTTLLWTSHNIGAPDSLRVLPNCDRKVADIVSTS